MQVISSRRRYITALWLAPLVLSACAHATPPGTHDATAHPVAAEPSAQLALRDLWVEHVFWIRGYVFASHNQQPAAAKAAEAEVVENARAIADAIIPFYGQAAADQLFALLAGHWGAVKGFNHATLQASPSAQQSAIATITANARQIAQFLSSANPHLPEQAVFDLLAVHGQHHVEQIEQVAADQFTAEARTWHAMRTHMLVIADALATALARQFPGKA